jgi:hypothetical protein
VTTIDVDAAADVAAQVKEANIEHYLGELADAVRYGELVDSMKLLAVKKARDEGATWERIGEVLGISHQGARSTWQRRLKALTSEQPH